MMSVPPLPVRPGHRPALQARLALLAAGLTMATTALAGPEPWVGTAYLRQEIRHTFEGQTYGLGRQTLEGLVALCNVVRREAGLPETHPPEDLMAGLDTETVERYFDNGRALTRRQGYGLVLPDMRRWMDERTARPTVIPAVPPDCSVTRKVDNTSTLLWKDGIRYELRADGKGSGHRRHATLSPRPLGPTPEGSGPDNVHGQPCLRVRVSSPVAKGDSCLWTGYPLQEYLNFPWALASHRVIGMGPQPLVEDVRTLEMTVGRASPRGLFELPADVDIKILP
ncbi:hypothetical protein QRD43_05195 [Pelomonas sp. APW6]|uniref:Uncharacterized protein n=1 Tax=Roseateles subflavus TaxID=3053353 RepID=A0ABT7LEN4_9BURK|nr:hypothetical protein [Pelomonas sp. APW6]MDL5031298.1 hypothetical protein [Pelomonas sp. APW6]